MHDRKIATSWCLLELLDGGWIQHFLIDEPEFGMGYHIVDLELKTGIVISDLVIFGHKTIELPEQHKDLVETDIAAVTSILRDGRGITCRGG